MPWKKGQSGNPLGRLPGEKQFADQLRIVLAEPVDKNDPKSVRKMRRIAEKLAECALNGEPWAISQVADRIDGKATAEIKTDAALRRRGAAATERRGMGEEILAAEAARNDYAIAWSARGNPAQLALLECPIFEVFYWRRAWGRQNRRHAWRMG